MLKIVIRVGRELAREEVNAETESSQEHFQNAGKRVSCCTSPIIETLQIFLFPLLIVHLPPLFSTSSSRDGTTFLHDSRKYI